VQLDHLILTINDLDRGVADFERLTGVRPVFGGVHPGRGTRNALVSLGDGPYLEILAPDPAQPNPSSPMLGLRDVPSLTPSAWALATTDLGEVRKRAEAASMSLTDIVGGSRALPDGSRLEWATLGVTEPAHEWMPFFIQWRNPALQPSHTSPQGCRLASLTLQHPDPAPLRRVFDAVGYAFQVLEGTPARMAIALDCPNGRVEFK